MNRTKVLVVGYPRSGNTWLARLLGQILDSPVDGYLNANPIAKEGLHRQGDYVVHQLHLRPGFAPQEPEVIPTAYVFNRARWQDERVIHIYRDPRDVAVSSMHYWDLSDIYHAVRCMVEADHPLHIHGSWLEFVQSWLAVYEQNRFHNMSYELLHSDTHNAVYDLVLSLQLLPAGSDTRMKIKRAIESQAFDRKRQHIVEHGNAYNYGKNVQLKHMRKGVVGDWKNWFDDQTKQYANDQWGDWLYRYGYTWE